MNKKETSPATRPAKSKQAEPVSTNIITEHIAKHKVLLEGLYYRVAFVHDEFGPRCIVLSADGGYPLLRVPDKRTAHELLCAAILISSQFDKL